MPIQGGQYEQENFISPADPDDSDVHCQTSLKFKRNSTGGQHSASSALQVDARRYDRHPTARELQDKAAQAMAMGLHNLDLHDAKIRGDEPDASPHLTLARSHLAEALDAIRDLSRQSSGPWTRIGLAPAIARYAESLLDRTDVRLSTVGDLDVLPETHREEVYSIICETLSNAAVHGEPCKVDVTLRTDGQYLNATVTYDGVGRDISTVITDRSGAGLDSVRERAELLGGMLHIADRPQAGTVVTLTVPITGQRMHGHVEPLVEARVTRAGVPGARIRLVVVDDHNLFRTGLVSLLKSVPTFVVEAEGSTGAEAVALCRLLRPDVLILDIEMPGSDPHEVLSDVLRDSPNTKVIILSMHDGAQIRELVAVGVSGFLHKSVDYPALRTAIDSVLMNSDQLVIHLPQKSLLADERADAEPAGLISTRELEVLSMLSKGMSNAELARQLFISLGTVKRHLTNIYRKLGAVSRVDALRRAEAAGMLPARHLGQRSPT